MSTTKTLQQILGSLKNSASLFSEVSGATDITVTGITANSKLCKPGSIFVATKGAHKNSSDGHSFIDSAIKNGAGVIVIDSNFKLKSPLPVVVLRADDTKLALCFLCEAFYDFPSSKLSVIGITGTNGKTSCSFMLHSILQSAGISARIMGTLGMGEPGVLSPLTHTTMEPEFISKSLRQFISEGVTHVVMEVSSHALSLSRVEAINFSATALTNISQDHLDFHLTNEHYQNAKGRLFFDLSHAQTKVVLPQAQPWPLNFLPSKASFFGHLPKNDCYFVNAHENGSSNTFVMMLNNQAIDINLPFMGNFHILNACLSALVAHKLNISVDAIKAGLVSCTAIPGRMEPVPNKLSRRVFIDFAHTPHALSSLLKSVKSMRHQKIILVFGCGGNRDQDKRAKMAQAAHEFADHIIITDDNPRDEDPEKIRADILQQFRTSDQFIEIPDRSLAIERAIKYSTKNDIVLIAGKGHETYQIYGNKTLTFSDLNTAKKVLENL